MSKAVLAFALLGLACSGPPDEVGSDSPYRSIEPDRTIQADSLSGPVDVVRDEFGIPHIWATSIDDAAFANGYVMAGDRLQQMDLFRHFASGTTAELFGGLAPAQIDSDIRLRVHQFRPLAEMAWAELSASTEAKDQELARYLERFTDGINAFIAEAKANPGMIDGSVSVFLNLDTIADWSPVDSLTIGRLQTWALSYDENEVRITEAFDKAQDRFATMGRDGAAFDLFPVRPMDTTSTIDGWPNVGEDTGSRAKPSAARPGGRRTHAPWALLDQVRRTLDVGRLGGLHGPDRGSNNWVVGPGLGGGSTLLANDPHLDLMNPPIWYFLHITVPDLVDMEGGSFAGLPGILLGHNAHIAWGGTVVIHDVTDYYLETIVPCDAGGGDCVVWNGTQVPIQKRQEVIKIGTLGVPPLEERTVEYEYVPHHGPLIPEVQNGQIVPRTGTTAISVKYTGYEVTQEVRAFYGVSRAGSVMEARDALQPMGHGAQNFVIVDDQGHIGWTTTAHVPWRTPGCFGWSRSTPDGIAPFLVIPGDGSCEWEKDAEGNHVWMDHRYVPHSFDPEKGYLATANADPMGETFDGDPLNGPMVDGRPLYAGAFYDPGFRVGRITRRLEELKASGQAITADDMASVQADAHSNYGDRMRPFIMAAAAELAEEIATPGTHADLETWVAGLSTERRAKLTDAASRLAAWTLDTPAGVASDAGAPEISDSIATTIFAAWSVSFIRDAFADELAVIDERPDLYVTTRTSLAIFERPGELASGLDSQTGEPALCDDLNTNSEHESCTFMVLRALDEAITWAEGELGPAPDDWRWGKKHTVTFTALTPQEDLNLPASGMGYPRHGDNFNVDVGNPGIEDFDFTYGSGASMRHVTVFTPGQPPRTRNALPGGQVFDPNSPHFKDLGEAYWIQNRYFDMPWSSAEVIAAHESRWVLAP